MESKWNTLSAQESRVIVGKGTEAPFSGKFDTFSEPGVYTCRRCGVALYRAEDKFDAHCGWPAFDAEIPGAVSRKTDPDGRRIEIDCANCGGHLGHVFLGEKFTKTNTRHCVNSISMDFVSKADLEKKFETAVFAGGCFWGVEYFLQQARGVIYADSGYTGGKIEAPTYEQVCSGKSGHIEAVKVVYDPMLTSYETLAKLFFEIHDPTQIGRQGPDVGEQYQSVIFVNGKTQQETTEKLIETLEKKGYKVATKIQPAGRFWPAEKYHQDYYFQKKSLPYCHQYTKRFD